MPIQGRRFLLACAIAMHVAPALAANCNSDGTLRFIGKTNDLQQTVWLSATTAGSFALEAAQQNLRVDEWSRGSPGLHLSLSPVVSQGGGGTHRLFDISGDRDCLLDTQNQQGGIILPPEIIFPPIDPPEVLPPIGILPPVPPIGVLPPVGIMPEVPVAVLPPIGTIPPTGITPEVPVEARPPIAILPPEGITPERPVKPEVPIGTLPPEGITPEKPVKPEVPIGTLPPEGITPDKPVKPEVPIGTLPPEGITPDKPVKPEVPIGTLPPEGITPDKPVKPEVPIGTLPPEGITPEKPVKPEVPIGTLPPEGITPEVPVQPEVPIGTLPPEGITPVRPVKPEVPIGTLPPEGITPERPVKPEVPIGTLPPEGITPERPVQPELPLRPRRFEQQGDYTVYPNLVCFQPQENRAVFPNYEGGEIRCPEGFYLAQYQEDASPDGRVPITPGREMEYIPVASAAQLEWNSWVDVSYLDISEDRHGLDNDGHAMRYTVGLDRRIDEGVVLGMRFSLYQSELDRFSGTWEQEIDRYTFGPYLAWQVAENWVLDAALRYTEIDVANQLLSLSGYLDGREWATTVSAHGQYRFDDFNLRPGFTVYWRDTTNNSMSLRGRVQDQPVTIRFPGESFEQGIVEATFEANRTYKLRYCGYLMPFAEVGARYEFERPGEGRILAGDLSTRSTSPSSGLIRFGGRWLPNSATMLDAEVAYQSLGQSGLDIWEARLLFSHSF